MDEVIYIRRGDALDFDGTSFTVTIKDEEGNPADLTGYTGRFQIQDVVKDVKEFTNGSCTFNLTKNETDRLEEGNTELWFKLFDPEGRPGTVGSCKVKVLAKEVKNGPVL